MLLYVYLNIDVHCTPMSKLENCSHKLKIWKHAHRAIAGRSVLLYILSLVIRISTFGREERDNRNLLTTWAGNMENRGYYTVVNVKFKTGRKTFSVLISLHLTPKFNISVCPRVATKQCHCGLCHVCSNLPRCPAIGGRMRGGGPQPPAHSSHWSVRGVQIRVPHLYIDSFRMPLAEGCYLWLWPSLFRMVHLAS